MQKITPFLWFDMLHDKDSKKLRTRHGGDAANEEGRNQQIEGCLRRGIMLSSPFS
jgi:hypothetical protein